MRILVISHKYFPFSDPRAFRWTSIAQQWASEGHGVDVVSAWKLGIPREESRNGVRIHRVGGKAVEGARRLLAGTASVSPGGFPPGESVGTASGVRGDWGSADRIVRRIGRVLEKVWWPDYAWNWYRPAAAEAEELLRRTRYDALVTVSIPFTGHLVGYSLKKKYRHLRWLVDIGDPFSFMKEVPQNNHRVYGGLNRSWEEKILLAADVVSVTTVPTRDTYADWIPEIGSKTSVIPPLYSPVDRRKPSERIFPDDGRIRLVYVGTLYKHLRNPEFLLEIFGRLAGTPLGNRLELHFFGSINDCGGLFGRVERVISDRVYRHGKVPRARVFQAMDEATVLVNIGNYTAYQLPSKVVEYGAAGKPILNLCRLAEDSSKEFFRDYPSIFNISERDPLDADQMTRISRFLEAPPPISEKRLTSWLRKYRADTLAAEYMRLIGSAI